MLTGFLNVFHEPASAHDLKHRFDILNISNDGRISFKTFISIAENLGISFTATEGREVYDKISNCGKNQTIDEESFTLGIGLSKEQENVAIFYKKLLNGGQYDYQDGRAELNMDEMSEALKDHKEEWLRRVQCMESFTRQMSQPNLSVDKFHGAFRTFLDLFIKQSKDPRTSVQRVACESLSKIVLRWNKDYLRYAPKTIEKMYELVRINVLITSQSGTGVIRTIIKVVPDSRRLTIMEALGTEATTSKFQDLKAKCFDFLCLYLSKQVPSLKGEDEFWNKIVPYVEAGIKDVANVRDSALWLFAMIQQERIDLALSVIKKMGDHLKDRYEKDFQGKSPPYLADEQKLKEEEEKSAAGVGAEKRIAHMRKRTWTNEDLFSGFQKMEKKAEITKEQTKTKEKAKPKKAVELFPRPPEGVFWNPFAENLIEPDIFYGFDQIDTKMDRRITRDEFDAILVKLGMDTTEKDKLFDALDVKKQRYVEYDDFKKALTTSPPELNEFWRKLLSASNLELPPRDDDMDLDTCSALLRDTDGNWEQRIKGIHSFCRMCVVPKLKPDNFHKMFRRMALPMCIQVKDRRSMVMRETCIALAKIMIARKSAFLKFAPRILETLYECIRQRVEIVHYSAHQCAKTMIRFVPDSKKFPLFSMVVQGACDKSFQEVRMSSFEFINLILDRMIISGQERPEAFWKLAEKALLSGVQDADADVRDAAYSAVARCDTLNNELCARVLKKLSRAQMKKYEQIKETTDKLIASADFGKQSNDPFIFISDKTEDTEIEENFIMSPATTEKKIEPDTESKEKENSKATANNSKTPVAKKKNELDPSTAKKPTTTTTTATTPSASSNTAKKPTAPSSIKPTPSTTQAKTPKTATPTTSDPKTKTNTTTNKTNTTPATTPNLGKTASSGSDMNNSVKKQSSQPPSKEESKKRRELLIAGAEAILNAFQSVDEDSDSLISLAEFEKAMTSLDVTFTTEASKVTFQAVQDPDTKEGLIDLEGFVIALHMCEPTYDLLWEELKKGPQLESFDSDNTMEIDINMILEDKGTSWREKTHAMRVALEEITKPDLKDSDKQQLIKKVTKGFMDALRSEDERVIFSACYILSVMGKAVTGHMSEQLGKLLRVLWELLEESSPLILRCANQCVTMLLYFVPDNNEGVRLKTIIQGTMLKGFNAVQMSSFDWLSVLIERNEVNDEFWPKVKEAITEGIKVSDPNIKARAFHTLMIFETVQSSRAKSLLDSLDANTRAEYTKAKENEQNNNETYQNEDATEKISGNENKENETQETETHNNAKEEVEESNDKFTKETTTSLNTATSGSEQMQSVSRDRAFSTVYGEHKTQLEEIYSEFDKENKGFLTVEQTKQFLKEMGVTGQEAEIAFRGLDTNKNGQIQKKDVVNWCFHKSPELTNNPVLEKEAIQYGWIASKEERLEQRIKLYRDLMEVDKSEGNYNGVFDCDMKLAVLQYLVDKIKRTGGQRSSGTTKLSSKVERGFD